MLKGQINLKIDFLEALAQDLGDKSFKLTKSLLRLLEDGTGLNQAQRLYGDSLSVVQSVNTDIDLAPGPTGAFGAVLFAALKAIIVVAGEANPADLTVGNVTNGIVGPFAAATNSLKCAPGGCIVLVNPSAGGWSVTAGTADLLRIASAATVGTYTADIVLLGI